MEVSRHSLCGFRLFYDAVRGMLQEGPWAWMVYPYENQPWEKLLALCAREAGVGTVGVQTAILSPYYLPYALGKGENRSMPLPDWICTSGPYAHQVFLEGGNPPERLRMIGSIRYPHLAGGTDSPSRWKLPEASSLDILVALPIDRVMAQHLLAALQKAFPGGGQREGIRFHIKPHPICPISKKEIRFPARWIPPQDFQNLGQALQQCGVVLFSASTVGFEALAAGRKVLRFQSELLIDVDDVYGESIPACVENNLRQVLLGLVREASGAGPEGYSQPIVPQLFAPFTPEALKDLFLLRVSSEPVVK
jgi:surface carbohydrate biosynthesis protein (TIGR04326 family)